MTDEHSIVWTRGSHLTAVFPDLRCLRKVYVCVCGGGDFMMAVPQVALGFSTSGGDAIGLIFDIFSSAITSKVRDCCLCVALCSAVLCYVVLCCAVLCCAVLCCAVLCCVLCCVVCCAVLCCAVLRCLCVVVCSAVLCCVVLCTPTAAQGRVTSPWCGGETGGGPPRANTQSGGCPGPAAAARARDRAPHPSPATVGKPRWHRAGSNGGWRYAGVTRVPL